MPYELEVAGAYETRHSHDFDPRGADQDGQASYEAKRNKILADSLDAQRKTLEQLIKELKPSEPTVVQMDLDAAAPANFPAIVFMQGLQTARSCYVENPTAATVYVYVGPVPMGVPLMRVSPGTYRQYPTHRDTKEVCVAIAAAQLPQTGNTFVRVILTSALWGPGAGAVS